MTDLTNIFWFDQRVRYRRRSGGVHEGSPLDITDFPADPIVSVEFGHACADRGFEFLMRDLLQAAYGPPSFEDWARLLLCPPTPGEIAERLAPYREAFRMDHPDTPAFQVCPTVERLAEVQKPKLAKRRKPVARAMSDDDGDDDEEDGPGVQHIAALLPDLPTGEASRTGADFFNKRDGVAAIGAGAILPVLYAHMVLFPPGGGGYFGLPHGADSIKYQLVGRTLWETLWLNVLGEHDPDFGDERWSWPAPAREVFPWLLKDLRVLPLGRADAGAALTQERAAMHPAAIPMPRRYRLAPAEVGECSLTGLTGPVYRTYMRWPKGLQYAPRGWWHLAVAGLPPKEGAGEDNPRFVKARGPLRFDDWLDIALQHEGRHRLPKVVRQLNLRKMTLKEALEDRETLGGGGATAYSDTLPVRVRAFAQYFLGKPVGGMTQRELPVWHLDSDELEELPILVNRTVETLAALAGTLAGAAAGAVKLGRTEGRVAAADDLKDALLADMDAQVLALPARVIGVFRDRPDAASRRDRLIKLRREICGAAFHRAVSLFDTAFPIDSANAFARRLIDERGRMIGTMNSILKKNLPEDA
jgi:CRISPR system Cascade subunit CasA